MQTGFAEIMGRAATDIASGANAAAEGRAATHLARCSLIPGANPPGILTDTLCRVRDPR
jgi:6-phosphofructokinase